MSWLLVALLLGAVVQLRRRLARVARAEHELRGPLTAVALAAESIKRGRAADLEAELLRARLALDDLTAARGGGRLRAPRTDLERIVRSSARSWGARVQWRAGAVSSDVRAARIVGNLLANAAEHGNGDAVVRVEIVNTKRDPVAIPVRTAARGRGLGIAAAAARAAGGSLAVDSDDREFRATLDLPLAR